MSSPAEPLTNDPIALQAMFAAERAENERLRQIIKELQRHRFGRRAESLPLDQLLLGLEEAEQIEAEGFAAEDGDDPAKREARARKRRANRGALAFCWAHVRRRFYELAQSGPAPIATEALQRIAELYKIESEIRGRSPEERRTARQERSRPVIDALQPWLREKLALVSQKSKLAEAIRYTLSRWAGLGRFLDDGRVEIDSNVVERSIRPIALNRKNALFAGSDGGGEHWATIASLIETAKLNGVDPYAYLADVITRIVAGHPQSQLDDLLPWAYAPAPLKAVA